jgi:hypothetical protein
MKLNVILEGPMSKHFTFALSTKSVHLNKAMSRTYPSTFPDQDQGHRRRSNIRQFNANGVNPLPLMDLPKTLPQLFATGRQCANPTPSALKT